MSRADYHLQHSIMGMLGSFWSRAVSEKTKGEARAIATQAADAPDLRRLDVPMQKLLSERRVMVERVRVPFLDGDFVVVGPDLTNVWRSSLGLVDGSTLQIIRRDLSSPIPRSQLLLGSNGRPLGSHLGHLLSVVAADEGLTGSEMLYVLPIPEGLTPIVIATRYLDRVLVQGVDFETGPGYIAMRDSPGQTFFEGGFTVLTGWQELRLPYDFTMQLNGPSYGHSFVAAYYRGSSSVASFERAAAQAAGLFVLEKDDTLLSARIVAPGVTRYTFSAEGVVDLDYPHEALTPGVDYAKGLIVSNGFRIIGYGGTGWLRRSSAGRHLNLDGVSSVPGLFLGPGLTTAYFSETGENDKPHARVQLVGSESSLVAHWSLQLNHEKAGGVYLSDVIGLSASLPKVAFDQHALLEEFYGRRLLLVLPGMDGAAPSYKKRLDEFLIREKPIGSVLVIAEEPAGLDPEGSYEPAGSINGLYEYNQAPFATPPGALVYGAEALSYDNMVLVYGAVQ